ncbi:M4 family peptidase [Nonomuraea mesophila]|uniref:M4 family peptidase n=1 Tax=Nonomuraea mesophila TaxID=2530382 RepID=A0A4R5EQA4_9ACTN|nr:M4 family metallopeptidase [Nonomuraea mesophila]TDE36864.1 M4 family peptidase [Nonomuraea mesophila]
MIRAPDPYAAPGGVVPWRSLTLVATGLCLALSMAGTASADDPPQPEIETRAGTRAPAEVSGLSEPARAGDPVAAARAHLTDPRYHLDPANLRHLRTVVDGQDETVRFAQHHRGLPVLGGQYLVHFRTVGDRREVTGAGGRFHTELTVDTKPAITARTAAVLAHARLVTDRRVRAATKAAPGELIVLPRGEGVLAWQVTLTGADPVRKRPVLRDAYVDAHTGRPLFAIDRLHMEGPVVGGGRTAHGDDVELHAYQRGDGVYELRDRSRPMWNGTTGEILTYDAAGADLQDFLSPGVPAGARLVESPALAFGPEHTDSGAVDAHWGAGKVYEYYRALGREGLDGAGGTMYSVVNVTFMGAPFINALWDGTKMIYGGGGPDFHSLAAGLDVVGHEMTHGVIAHSADLVYAGQSGAVNEGLADYFGNAVQVDTLGIAMSDPQAALLGESLCKNLPPAECASRDLGDGRNAVKDYVGVTLREDGGGVHFNSTIFSGALWDVRKELGAGFDKVVYRALTAYMTPLDDFADARRAVESAARAKGLSARDRRTIGRAFDRHGIKPGWERRVRTDSEVLIDGLSDALDPPALAGDRYVVTNSTPDLAGPTMIVAGWLRGGEPAVLSDNDRWNLLPATDGERAAWVSYDPEANHFQIRARPLDAGTPSAVLHEGSHAVLALALSGDAVAWSAVDPDTGEAELWLKRGTADPVNLTAGEGVEGYQPSIGGGRLVYVRAWSEGTRNHSTPVVHDLATGEVSVIPETPSTGPAPSFSAVPAVTSRHVLWLVDTDRDGRAGIMRAGTDGGGVTAIVPDGPQAPQAFHLDANDRLATVSHYPGAFDPVNENLPKLLQVPVKGGEPVRYSCNRGEQSLFASGEGARVLWLDGTAGDTDLVTRSKPARRC